MKHPPLDWDKAIPEMQRLRKLGWTKLKIANHFHMRDSKLVKELAKRGIVWENFKTGYSPGCNGKVPEDKNPSPESDKIRNYLDQKGVRFE